LLTYNRPIFFISTLLIFLFYAMSSDSSHSIPVPASPPLDHHYKYTVQKGLFLQSEDSTDDSTFDFVDLPPNRQNLLTNHPRKSKTSA
jgi:hypothetical protein